VRYRHLAQAQAVWLIIMTPKQVQVMAAYFEATDQLADATDDLIKAHAARRAGLPGNCAQFAEEVAKIRLAAYRKARADYESL